MELSLVVRTGEDAGRRIPVPSGAPVRVGRTPPSEVRLPDDPMLSNLHFSVECGPAGGRVRDLGSRFGTLLNGVKVIEGTLKDGDEITAGRTVFAVALAGPPADPTVVVGGPGTAGDADTILGRPGVVPADPPPPPAAALAPAQARLLDLLRRQPDPLFAVLDAAREPSVVDRLKGSGQEHQTLYDGAKGEDLAAFGPWLVRLPPPAGLLEDLVRDGWGKSWGVYLTSEAGLADVRRHLRKFLMAKLPDGRQVYFRYYDPRVLRTYLPTCLPDEMASFFGPVRRYILEGPDPAEAMEFAAAYKDWRKVTLSSGE
jgi:hypothetical protein